MLQGLCYCWCRHKQQVLWESTVASTMLWRATDNFHSLCCRRACPACARVVRVCGVGGGVNLSWAFLCHNHTYNSA